MNLDLGSEPVAVRQNEPEVVPEENKEMTPVGEQAVIDETPLEESEVLPVVQEEES